MEIDEHLKYTLYVCLLFLYTPLLMSRVAYNSTRARGLGNQWFRAGHRTTSYRQA